MKEPNKNSDLHETAARASKTSHATDYLANERTFLAWVRTSIAVISFGYVAGKLHVILPHLGLHRVTTQTGSTSLPIGVGMIAFGGVLAILAAWRYHIVNRQIESDTVRPDRMLIVTIMLLVVILASVMLVYLLSTPESV
jgi:putative membrane protein